LYTVPGGKEDAGRTASEISTILPVTIEMTMVASLNLSPITARFDARTVISEGRIP
jgi:hypothetical protein